jgi:hypothetical protein
MILRLLAFVLLVLALGSLAGDAWASYSSGLPFSLRSLEASWMAASPSTLNMAQSSWPGISGILPYPAVAVLGVLGILVLLPTIFLRQRH